MRRYKLTKYEQDLEDHFDEMKSVPNLKEEMKRIQEYAKYTLEMREKTQRLNTQEKRKSK